MKPTLPSRSKKLLLGDFPGVSAILNSTDFLGESLIVRIILIASSESSPGMDVGSEISSYKGVMGIGEENVYKMTNVTEKGFVLVVMRD